MFLACFMVLSATEKLNINYLSSELKKATACLLQTSSSVLIWKADIFTATLLLSWQIERRRWGQRWAFVQDVRCLRWNDTHNHQLSLSQADKKGRVHFPFSSQLTATTILPDPGTFKWHGSTKGDQWPNTSRHRVLLKGPPTSQRVSSSAIQSVPSSREKQLVTSTFAVNKQVLNKCHLGTQLFSFAICLNTQSYNLVILWNLSIFS